MDLGLGLGLRSDVIGRPGTVVSYDPDAEALFARMDVEPDAARRQLYSDVVTALKNGGVWDLLDAWYETEAHDIQAARLNWKQDAYNLVAVGVETWTVDQGFTYSSGNCHDTQFNPSTAVGAHYAQDSAVMGFRSKTSGQNASGACGNTNATILPRSTSDNFTIRLNSTVGVNRANTDGAGSFAAVRTSANQIAIYRDGTLADEGVSNNSTTHSNFSFYLGGRNQSTPSYFAGQVPNFYFGAQLSKTQFEAARDADALWIAGL